jgi:Ser/Thr protein kinase RdoA (MazF antagonist)
VHTRLLSASLQYSTNSSQTPITSLSQTSSARIIDNLLVDIDLGVIKNQQIVEIIESRKTLYAQELPNLRSCLLHDDINVTNILVDDHNTITGILDFDELYYGPIISCIANTAFEFARFSGSVESALEYITFVDEIIRLESDEMKLVKSLLELRNTMFLVYLLRFHGEDFEYVSRHLDLAKAIVSK